MTSMIDVIFLLLIFFICTASFKPLEEELPLNLSRPGTLAETIPATKLEEDFKFATLRIFPEDGGVRWQINDRSCATLGELGQVLRQLAQIKPDLPVLIDMDDNVAWEHFIHVYDLCRETGLSRIQLVGEQTGTPRENAG